MAGVLNMLLASATGTVTVSGENISDADISGGSASAGVRFNSDGTVDQLQGGVASQIDSDTDWVRPEALAPGAYQVRATLVSGDTPSGSLGSWLDLTSNRLWEITQSGDGSKSSELLIEVGLSETALDSGTYNLSADVTS